MNDQSTTRVQINGVTLDAPRYKDDATTRAIATEVQDTLRAVEEASDRIDTQRFALEACLKLATELQRERDRTKELENELGLQLASVNSSVENLLKLLD